MSGYKLQVWSQSFLVESLDQEHIADIQRQIISNMRELEIRDYALTLDRGSDFWAAQYSIIAEFPNPEDFMMYRLKYFT